MLMYFNLIAAVFVFTASIAQAQTWAAKAFRGQKVRLQKAAVAKIEAHENLMLIVDQECLRAQSDGSKRGHDPLKAAGFSVQHKISALKVVALSANLDSAKSVSELEEILQEQPCVLGASENSVVQTASDPRVSEQTYLAPIGQMQAEKFFFHPLFGINREVTVGVVDTGLQLSHPDLLSRTWRGPNGEVGFDVFNNDTDPSDDNGHGTHVAGILAAQRNNGVGIRGVMGEWARLMPVKAQDQNGNGMLSDVVNGLNWAVEYGAEVINLSLAAFSNNVALASALEAAVDQGVVLVAAAGNQNKEILPGDFVTPAGHAPEHEGLISVGSTDTTTGLRSDFSNYNPNYVEIAAPGETSGAGLLSTLRGSAYGLKIGTSMSTPQVAAAAALTVGFLKSRGAVSNPAVVERYILESASIEAANQNYFSGGRALNLENLGRYLFNSTVVDSTGGFDE